MGLDINGTQFILYAKKLGIDFRRTAMIGRQSLFLEPAQLQSNLSKFDVPGDRARVQQIFEQDGGYAEEFFRCLGAQDVDSFDNSNYEGATFVHDMNEEIPEEYKHKYSVVFDGGSLEHIFNFPTAIKNCMEMVQVGGHYLGVTPANNFMGHGFYQFSPELFFSVFTADNGFQLDCVIAVEDDPKAEWFSVRDPAAVKARVTLTNSKPVFLLVIAKRVEDVVPLQTTPQQSDYIAAWNPDSASDQRATAATGITSLRATVARYVPRSLKRKVRKQLRLDRPHMGFNPKFFKRVTRTAGRESFRNQRPRNE